MAFGSLGERLALIVDADVDGAIRGLKRVGDTAEKELGRAQTSTDRWGSRLTTVGAGMVAFGAVALAGLGKAAMAAEEAEMANIRLMNSVANNANLTTESADAFRDLASALAKKTAADDDSIISGQAVLAQFGLTEQQILQVTPLVVDYARKMGVDLDTASRAVGKAIDGTNTTLKRQGITFDETAFAADHFQGTIDALAGSVGGFAEAEGKTFSGQIAILKNQLGELAEGVGVGAVSAFQSFLGPVTAVSEKLAGMSSSSQATVGKFGALGAAGLVAVGGLTAVAGSLIKLRTAFTNADGSITRTGKGLAGLGSVATLVSIAAIGNSMNKLTVDAAQLGAAFNDNVAEALQFSKVLAELGGGYDDITSQLANQSIPVAQQFVDALAAEGEEVGELQKIIDDKMAADVAGAQASQLHADAMAEALDPGAALTEEYQEQLDALNALIEGEHRQLDAVFSLFDAELAYKDQLDQTREAIAESATTTDDAKTANNEYEEALRSAEGAALDQADAALALYEKTAAASGATLSAAEKNTIYKAELQKVADTLAPGSPLRVALEGYIARLNAIPLTISSTINFRTTGTIPGSAGGPKVFHSGGVVPGPPGTEVAAILRAGEIVIDEKGGIGGKPVVAGGGGVTVIIQGNVIGVGSEAELVAMIGRAAERGVRDARFAKIAG